MFKTNKEIKFLIFILAICVFSCTSDEKSLPEKGDSLQIHQEIHSENTKQEVPEIRDSIQIPEIVIPRKNPLSGFYSRHLFKWFYGWIQ